jgi:sterol desaturase/sphingolipid hydroxylase (fatty acid hydroxylase superfamily)
MKLFSAIVALCTVLPFFTIPEMVFAYGGPGSVISGIGAFLAAVAALVASLFSFIWFPLKRLYHRVTNEDPSSDEATVQPSEE